MQFNITINQRAIIEAGLEIDLQDAAILDFIRSFSNSNGISKLSAEGKTYYWFSYKKILEEMPLLKMAKDTLYRRFRYLEEMGLLDSHPDNSSLGKSYYAMTDRLHALYHSTPGEKSEGSGKNPYPHGELSVAPPEKTPDNHSTSNHITISSNTPPTPQGSEEGDPARDSFEKENKIQSDLDGRVAEFRATVYRAGGMTYTDQMLDHFVEYWTEPDHAPKPKMKFEKQKHFEVKRRLKWWATNTSRRKTDGYPIYRIVETEDIKKKKNIFKDQLRPFVDKYGSEFMNYFYQIWSMPENVPEPKFLMWEREEFWDLANRLAQYHTNWLKKQRQPQR